MGASKLDRFVRAARADSEGTLVALDVDGTISPIVSVPDQAMVSDELRSVLARVQERYRLWFISGREADVARRIVGLPDARYIGAHGLEVLDEEGLRPLVDRPDLQSHLARVIDGVTAEVPEVAPYVEAKRWGVSFHYRALASTPGLPARLLTALEAQLTPELRVLPGKMVFEVGPAFDRDKGSALAWLIDTLSPRRALAAGDDRTDVAMFRALAARAGEVDGISVAVLQGSETPEELIGAADTTVDGVAGVHALLTALVDEAG